MAVHVACATGRESKSHQLYPTSPFFYVKVRGGTNTFGPTPPDSTSTFMRLTARRGRSSIQLVVTQDCAATAALASTWF